MKKKTYTAKQKKQILGCLSAALDKKAEDVLVLDLRGVSCEADFFVICHGESRRQVQAISHNVESALREQGIKRYNVEGREAGTWILMDFHNIVVHVFHQTARSFYALEKLWADARSLDESEILAWG